ncbi:MAG: sugar kinase [Actinobacteria bacterium]|nr:sugar kinase [Actinomycetota bacterium]
MGNQVGSSDGKPKARVVSLGIHIVDILGRPVTHIPEGQHVALLEEIRITVAGTAAGTSVDLAKLGADVVAMGAVGTDELGNFLVSTMQRYGIDTTHLIRKSGVQTSATMLPIRPNGERPALHVTGANGELTFDDVDLDVIAGARFLHMGGTSLLPKFDGEPTRKVLQFAREHGVITTFDLVAVDRPDLLDLIEPCLPYVDYFMPGFEEAQMMCKLRDRKDVIAFFLDRGVGHTVFKMGSQGSSIASKDGEIRLPAFKVPVVDSTGCGDAYCAGFIVGLSMGWDLEQAGRLGTAAAALVITGLGSDAGIVDLEHTLDFMNSAEALAISE